MGLIAFIGGLPLSFTEWLCVLAGIAIAVQTARLKLSKTRAAKAENELFKTQLTAGDKEQAAQLAGLDKETQDAQAKFQSSSDAYEATRDPGTSSSKPWRPGDNN